MKMMKHVKSIVCTSLILALVAVGGASAAPPPSSVSAANYYEMTPNHWYVSLGVKGYQQTNDATCGPAAVMSLMHWYKLLSDKNLTAETEMRIAREMGTGDMKSPRPGTTTEQMVTWLEKNGFV